MNINKKINAIQRNVSKQIDELVLKNLDELNVKIYEYYQPLIDQMQELVDDVYSHNYMSMEQFDEYVDKLGELSEPFKKDVRDNILFELSEGVIIKNKKMASDMIDNMFKTFAEQRLPITRQKAMLEYKKIRNSTISRLCRFLNENYREICAELRAIYDYSYNSLMEYLKSPRVVVDDDNEGSIEIEVEEIVENSKLIKMTELDDVIEFVVSHGFKKVRQCGSHAIYKNEAGNITVIPIHSGNKIDKGLAFQIQKEVYRGVAC